jgi:GPH family glycoside/pentoside/hexuronide:cation symporter
MALPMTPTAEADPTLLSDLVPLPESATFSAPAGEHQLSLPAFFGFSVGMIGDRIFRDAPALLLLIFMTDYLAIPPALAGAAIFIPKLLIMFVDPLVGTLSDRLDTRWGRRRPPMLIGAVLASISILLFFHVPRFGTPLAQASYMSVMVFLGFSGYSLFSVPYLVMASEIADSDAQRRKIMSWRVVFMAIGLSISAFAGGFVQAVGGGVQGYRVMSWVYAAVCLVTMLGTVLATVGIPIAQGATNSLPLREQFRLLASSHRYLRLLLVGFLQKLAEGVGYGSFAYFCIYVVNQPLSGIGLVVLSATAGQVLTQPLWLRASKRWAPSTLYTVGVIGWCLNLALWLAMKGRPEWWLIPLGLQGGASAGGFLMVTLAMLSNTMAADTAETGVNREGIFSGFWLAAEKLAFAAGALVVGVVIALFGFVESTNGVHVHQTPTAVMGIGFTYCGINMLIYLISIVAIRRFARLEKLG